MVPLLRIWEQAAALAALVLVVTILIPAPSEKVTFLDVGQGDSILFQDGTAQMLIDGGPGANVLARLGEELPWFDKQIEVVVVTHPQQDHLEGLLHVLERYKVGLVLFPEVAYNSNLYREWLKQVQERNIPYRFSEAGEELKFQNMNVRILAPFTDEAAKTMARANVNNGSTTTHVDFAGMSFLLSGDAERPAERMLISRTAPGLLDIDVLKAGHHGSKTSTTQELLNATTPKSVAISVGRNNRYGHPSQEVLTRLANLPVFRTDQSGSVRFTYVGDTWLLKTQR